MERIGGGADRVSRCLSRSFLKVVGKDISRATNSDLLGVGGGGWLVDKDRCPSFYKRRAL